MSDASHSHEEEAHEGPVKTPKQLIVTIIFSFAIPIFVCVMLATYVTTDPRMGWALKRRPAGLRPWAR